ncbi:MAG: S8 family peptidase [Vicinamibacterales bacterium]|nr:S8 family peptidase [Vicinamibacterales bacterium]
MHTLARLALVVAVLVGASVAFTSAQQRTATFPVIVVFDDFAPFQDYVGQFVPDGRMAENPAAWAYQDRAVVGAVQALERAHGFRATHAYSAALRGFAAHLTARQIAALEGDPLVRFIEPDGAMHIVQRPPGKGGGGGGSESQTVPWGITRIGAAGKPSVTTVHAYIIDTGIDAGHRDLSVVQHVNFAGGPNKDCNGHGTHVAGTVAAIDNTVDVVGVAAGARLVGVKVLGCGGSGTTSGVIQGVDWVTANAVKPAVANLSLGGGASNALDTAVKNSADSGVFYAVAAGNSGADACTASPARAGTHHGVMTTAATDQHDLEASWSNYGSCVDVWAPGVAILSTASGGGTTTLSGTSMASPHVAGTGVRSLALAPGASAAQTEHDLKISAEITGTTSKDGRAIELINARPF